MEAIKSRDLHVLWIASLGVLFQ